MAQKIKLPMSLGKWKSKSDAYDQSYGIDWEMRMHEYVDEDFYYDEWVLYGITYEDLMQWWDLEEIATLSEVYDERAIRNRGFRGLLQLRKSKSGRFVDVESAYDVQRRRELKINRVLGSGRIPLIGTFAIGDMIDWKK